MKKVIDFLEQLRRNNDKVWFDAHREEYKMVQAEFNEFAEELLKNVSAFDSTVAGLGVKDVTYRIYRDVRFSPNKDPYKTHMGVYICPGGKKSGYGGYYFHIEPSGGEGNIITSGLYLPEPKVLRSVREEISVNGEGFEAAVTKAEGFVLDESSKLKRLPAGFAPGSPWDEYLKLKDVYLIKVVDNDWLLQKDLAAAVAAEFAKTYDFLQLMNRAAAYAFEN